jgi:2-amino-4-hydroxy-6-hydroxymethyldihydropteridine diphosphokinase
MAMVYLALGTNLGDREENLRAALEHLDAKVKIKDRSPIYETEPWGLVDQPRFLNMVVSGETTLDPHALMHFLKDIERTMGRTPGIRYGPRVIDLDLLLYDDVIVTTDDLIVPHARMFERRFVLVPLADIAPDRVHPLLGESVRVLLARLPDDASVKPYISPFQ